MAPAHLMRLLFLCLVAAAVTVLWRKAGMMLGQLRLTRPYREESLAAMRAKLRDIEWSVGSNMALNERLGWHVPFNRLPFTPILNCEPSLEPDVAVLMSRFDWHYCTVSGWSKPDGKRTACQVLDGLPLRLKARVPDPKTVWACPHLLHPLLEIAERTWDDRRADRLIVFLGNELPLSWAFGTTDAERNRTLARLRRYFGRIVYQNQDILMDGVHVSPMGFCYGYLMTAAGEWPGSASQFAVDFERGLPTSLSSKSTERNILASWGRVAPHLDDPKMEHYLRGLIRKGLHFPKSNASAPATLSALIGRRELRNWAQTDPAKAAGVEIRRLSTVEWWQELPKYRFLLCPIGSAVQTSKVVEALLVLTVPVVEPRGYPVYGEIVKLGFPIVLVSSWTQVTRNSTDAWWRAMAPRLESFRRNCITVDAWWRIYTGELVWCE